MTEGDKEYFNNEEFKEILKQYEESVKSGGRIYMDADDLADIAAYYHFNNREEEAEEAISLAMEYNPEALGPMLYKAKEALEAKDFDTVEKYATKIEALDSLEAIYLNAEVLIQKNDVDKADSALLEFYNNEVPAEERTDYIKDVVELYLEYHQFIKAFEWIARITGSQSDGFKELMARTLFGLGKFKDSEKLFNELLDKNPYSTSYWNALAGIQYMKEDYNAAYSEKRPDDEFGYLNQAQCIINKGKFEEGLSLLKKAISVAPVDSVYLPEIYQEMSFVYNKLGNVEKALWCMDMMYELKCDHAAILVMRGHILLANKKEEEARKEFDKALEVSNNDPKTQLKVIISYHDNMHLNQAYQLYVEFFKNVDKEWNEGYAYMALCCNDLKKDEEFLYYLKKACECNPEEAKAVLCEFFPEDMTPKDYYDYALEHLND